MGPLQPLVFAAGMIAVTDPAINQRELWSMDNYLWDNRPVIVFTPEATDPLLAAQRASLDPDGERFRDRDMVLIEVTGDTVSVNGRPAHGADADGLRARYQVDRETPRAVLIGKDGGVKLRSGTAFSADELFATIDAMPMRNLEIRQRDTRDR
ncbi:MAG: DUF4174 domain-containing protein [Alphaproteobacteria bacterium]